MRELKHKDKVRIEFGTWRHDGSIRYLRGNVSTYSGLRSDGYEIDENEIGAFINQEPGIITSNKAANTARNEMWDSTPILIDGEKVMVDGREGTVKLNGNYSDMADIIF